MDAERDIVLPIPSVRLSGCLFNAGTAVSKRMDTVESAPSRYWQQKHNARTRSQVGNDSLFFSPAAANHMWRHP